jgi:hypothetical protein
VDGAVRPPDPGWYAAFGALASAAGEVGYATGWMAANLIADRRRDWPRFGFALYHDGDDAPDHVRRVAPCLEA